MIGGNGQTNIRDIVTLEYPLGPHKTEDLVGRGQDIFGRLYDETNGVHERVWSENPYFVVGRKGAGKTAFLLGAAFADDADVELIRSEDVYTEVDKLRRCYTEVHGPLVADRLAYAWEVLLLHAAMLAITRSKSLPKSEARRNLWKYMSAFGPPMEIKNDDLLAAVSAAMTEVLLNAAPGQAFRSACWSIEPGGRAFKDAVGWMREVVGSPDPKEIYVVVDNLEDLHVQLDDFAPVITALFRLTSRNLAGDDKEFPFRMRFAFPAEMLSRLNALTANAEKDFNDVQIIRWTAQELISIAGNRLRTFLDLYFPDAPKELDLPEDHKSADSGAAAATLRALLPPQMENRLGGKEESVAYLMRHTQLLPRHLILMLNHVMRRTIADSQFEGVPRMTQAQLRAGMAEAELRIVNGILTSYQHEYPNLDKAMVLMKNQIGVVEKASRLHTLFNQAGVSKKTGVEFDEFLDGCVGIGAMGIVTEHATEMKRYTQGKFSYTFVGDMRTVEKEDHVCVHPLFVSQLFDRHKIEKLAADGQRAIYPYGSDIEHVDIPS
jgi:hypothetical protein